MKNSKSVYWWVSHSHNCIIKRKDKHLQRWFFTSWLPKKFLDYNRLIIPQLITTMVYEVVIALGLYLWHTELKFIQPVWTAIDLAWTLIIDRFVFQYLSLFNFIFILITMESHLISQLSSQLDAILFSLRVCTCQSIHYYLPSKTCLICLSVLNVFPVRCVWWKLGSGLSDALEDKCLLYPRATPVGHCRGMLIP